MGSLRSVSAGLVSAALVVALAIGVRPSESAGQSTGARQTAKLAFAEHQAGAPSALDFQIDYRNPEDPGRKPPAVRRVVSTLAAGARFDTSVPPRCPASDAQLAAQGDAACPQSKVGGGFVRVDTGLDGSSRYLDTDVSLLNAADELIFVFTDRASGARVPVRAAVGEASTTTESPPLPGAPPDGGAVDIVDLRLDRISLAGGERAYIRTPGACPAGGAWTNTVEFTYADGVTQKTVTESPCAGAPGSGEGRCSNRLLGTKRSEALRGGAGSDRVGGRGGADRLAGRSGDDCIRGGGGADRIRGGAGDDQIRAGRGADAVRGGGGDDLVRARRGAGDVVACGAGDDVVVASRRKDTVRHSCETIR
jgi:hypothetical protein